MTTSSLFPRSVAVRGRYVKILYLDINTQYGQSNNQLLVENINAVNNELLNLILTTPGELDFEPDFGSEVPGLIFEQPTAVASWMIENHLIVAVNRWLPFITIDTKETLIVPLALQVGYYFKLVYSVAGINNAQADFRFQT